MEQRILIWMIVLLGTVGLVTAVPSVQLVDTNAISYLNIYEYNVSIHNNLTGLQGGSAPNEYYHLTAAEYTTLGSLVAGDYLNLTGGTMSGTIDMDGNSLTNVGDLIMTGLTTSQNIYPDTTGIYSIGNTTHWFGSIYTDNLYARGINATSINSTNMESEVLEVEDNITLGSFVMKAEGADMIIILT